MNIYIPIEVKARELEGRGLLAMVAAERGHLVIFGGKEDTLEFARSGLLKPGLVHDKCVTPSEQKIELYDDLLEKRNIITSQDEEHGLLYNSYQKFAKLRFGEETVSRITKLFTWGSFDYSFLVKEYEKYSNRFVSTGSPRVDFWREEFRRFYDSSLAKKTAPYILVTSNFRTVLNTNRFWDIVEQDRKNGSFERDQERELKKHYEDESFQLRLLGEFVRLIRFLSSEFPEVKIVVRPHPIEDLHGWKKLIGNYPNVLVLREGSVSSWIRNSFLVIHNGCTSGLEAATARVPCLAYKPPITVPDLDYERSFPNTVSYEANSLQEVSEMVGHLLGKKEVIDFDELDQSREDELSARFGNLSGELAAYRIVDEWEIIGSKNELNQDTVRKVMELGRITRLRRLSGSLSAITRVFSDKYQSKGFQTQHKFQGLEKSEITGLLLNLQYTLGRFHCVKVRQFGQRSFVLTSN